MDQQSVYRFVRGFGRQSLLFVKKLAHEFVDKGCQKNAAALTYMTLFALVPMITVIYSILSMIPFFHGVADQLIGKMFTNFVPETGDQLKGYLSDFSSQARNLTGVGVLMLFVTAFLMLRNIEKTFNGIWGIREARKGLSSVLLYWAVLSIGPLMLASGLTMSTYLLSAKLFMQEYDQLGLTTFLFKFIPLLMGTITFTLLFAAVPNCRVPLRYAVTGGFVTAIFFELLKTGFRAVVANSSFKLVYGAFAIVPMFLLWINLLWMTVLVGAVFVRTLSEQAHGIGRIRLSNIRAMLHCLSLFREKSQTGEKVTDRDCMKSGVSLVQWQHLLGLLVKSNWVAVAQGGGYALCRDLRTVSIWDVARLVNMPVDEPLPDLSSTEMDGAMGVWLQDYFDRRQRVERNARDAFGISLEALFASSSKSVSDT